MDSEAITFGRLVKYILPHLLCEVLSFPLGRMHQHWYLVSVLIWTFVIIFRVVSNILQYNLHESILLVQEKAADGNSKN